MSDNLLCPNCQHPIVIADTLAAQVRNELQSKFDAEVKRKNKELAEREEILEHQREKLLLRENEVEKELRKRLEDAFAEREETLGQRDRDLAARQKKLDDEVAKRIEHERGALEMAATEKARSLAAVQMNDLTAQLNEAKAKAQEAQQAELKLIKERRELEQKQQELELLVARTIEKERQEIREQATKAAIEASSLKEAESERLINDMRRQMTEMQRKIEQGSQQAQGEVLEEELEKLLVRHFPGDQICPVPKGVHGGDIVHRIVDGTGRDCGIILWETKRTKNWKDDWLPKLRNDQRMAKASEAILVSVELPKDVVYFAHRDGVWISNRACAVALAQAIRNGLLAVGKSLMSVESRQEKMDQVYNYVNSVEFKNRVGAIVEAFGTMRKELEAEKKAIQSQWAKREKQLERALANTAGMVGDITGITGHSLPAAQLLELPGGYSE